MWFFVLRRLESRQSGSASLGTLCAGHHPLEGLPATLSQAQLDGAGTPSRPAAVWWWELSDSCFMGEPLIVWKLRLLGSCFYFFNFLLTLVNSHLPLFEWFFKKTWMWGDFQASQFAPARPSFQTPFGRPPGSVSSRQLRRRSACAALPTLLGWVFCCPPCCSRALLFPSPLTSCRLWKGEVNSGGSICCIGPEACVSSFKSKYWKLVGFLNNCLIQLRPYYYYKIKGISRWFLSDLLILLNLWFNQFQCIGQTKDYSSMWVLCSKSCTVSWKNSAVGQGQGWVPSHRPLCSSELNHSPTLEPRSLFCE